MSNPFVSGSSAKASSTLDVFKEYAWDFDSDHFIFENGQHKIVTENEAIKVWIYKTLKTERWRYLAYDNAYGIELEQFIGAYTNNSTNATMIEQYIKEALLINPYITSVDSVKATIDGDKLSYSISLTTVYGTATATNQATTTSTTTTAQKDTFGQDGGAASSVASTILDGGTASSDHADVWDAGAAS